MGLPISGGPEHWNFPYKVKYGVSIAKPIFEESIILVCGYWNGSRAIKLGDSIDEVNLLWSEEEKIRGLMSQPLYREGVVYLLDRSNGLTAFLLKSGKILWRDNHQLTAAGRNPHASLVWVQPNGSQRNSQAAAADLDARARADEGAGGDGVGSGRRGHRAVHPCVSVALLPTLAVPRKPCPDPPRPQRPQRYLISWSAHPAFAALLGERLRAP